MVSNRLLPIVGALVACLLVLIATQSTATVINDGNGSYSGEAKNGKRHGYGQNELANGERYVGFFFRNRLEGRGTYYKKDRTYEGDFHGGEKHGLGILTYSNGDKYEGHFLNDKKDGFGIFTSSNGTRYEGKWSRDKRYGQGTLYLPNGHIKIGKWRNDQLERGATELEIVDWSDDRLSWVGLSTKSDRLTGELKGFDSTDPLAAAISLNQLDKKPHPKQAEFEKARDSFDAGIYVSARALFLKASNYGHPESFGYLSRIHSLGLGAAKNQDAAMNFACLGSLKNDPLSEHMIEDINGRPQVESFNSLKRCRARKAVNKAEKIIATNLARAREEMQEQIAANKTSQKENKEAVFSIESQKDTNTPKSNKTTEPKSATSSKPEKNLKQIVIATQKLLIKNMYLQGSADGKMGSTTIKAVETALEDSELGLSIYSEDEKTLETLENVFLKSSRNCDSRNNQKNQGWSVCFDVN